MIQSLRLSITNYYYFFLWPLEIFEFLFSYNFKFCIHFKSLAGALAINLQLNQALNKT